MELRTGAGAQDRAQVLPARGRGMSAGLRRQVPTCSAAARHELLTKTPAPGINRSGHAGLSIIAFVGSSMTSSESSGHPLRRRTVAGLSMRPERGDQSPRLSLWGPWVCAEAQCPTAGNSDPHLSGLAELPMRRAGRATRICIGVGLPRPSRVAESVSAEFGTLLAFRPLFGARLSGLSSVC